MAKCSGKIGFALTVETSPGVFEERIVEKPYKGNITQLNAHVEDENSINSNFRINNNISVVANKYFLENLGHMRYVTYKGLPFKITSFQVIPPRLIFSLGSVYNEQ